MRSLDTVDENARLVRFSYHYVLDDTEQDVSGEVREYPICSKSSSTPRSVFSPPRASR